MYNRVGWVKGKREREDITTKELVQMRIHCRHSYASINRVNHYEYHIHHKAAYCIILPEYRQSNR